MGGAGNGLSGNFPSFDNTLIRSTRNSSKIQIALSANKTSTGCP